MDPSDIKRLEELYLERIRKKKESEMGDLSKLLGIPVEDLGKTIKAESIKKEECFEYKLQGALTTLKDNYGGSAAILSDKQGILIGCDNGTDKAEAEKLSALVHVDKNPYIIDFEILKKYDMTNFKEYAFWTKDIENEFNLTIGFVPDIKRRII